MRDRLLCFIDGYTEGQREETLPTRHTAIGIGDNGNDANSGNDQYFLVCRAALLLHVSVRVL